MINVVSKVSVVVAMLIAFVGQALAYNMMPCEMSQMTQSSHMTMAHAAVSSAPMDHASMDHHKEMDHSKMHMAPNQSTECCGADCSCPISACSSVTFLHSPVVFIEMMTANGAIVSQNACQPKIVSTSLYRPPILA